MAMKMRLKIKNRSHRYDINCLRPRHGHKYTKKMCLSIKKCFAVEKNVLLIKKLVYQYPEAVTGGVL